MEQAYQTAHWLLAKKQSLQYLLIGSEAQAKRGIGFISLLSL
jgi:hypothetical protein